MTRLRRVVAVNVPHHLTQRGNARQYILSRDEDRAVYLKLLRENIEAYNVSLLGYCLMSNHVHLIAVPTLPDGLALACRNAHGRYAAYWNAIHGASGHAWQGRFYSCPLDEVHLWAALRYTELNPVRAGLVSEPECWPWSSAAVHCGKTQAVPWLDDTLWRNRWTERFGTDAERFGTDAERFGTDEVTPRKFVGVTSSVPDRPLKPRIP
jgi:putative transposase